MRVSLALLEARTVRLDAEPGPDGAITNRLPNWPITSMPPNNGTKALHYNWAAGDAAGPRYAAQSALQFYTQALDAAHNTAIAVGADVLLALYERLGESAYPPQPQGTG